MNLLELLNFFLFISVTISLLWILTFIIKMFLFIKQIIKLIAAKVSYKAEKFCNKLIMYDNAGTLDIKVFAFLNTITEKIRQNILNIFTYIYISINFIYIGLTIIYDFIVSIFNNLLKIFSLVSNFIKFYIYQIFVSFFIISLLTKIYNKYIIKFNPVELSESLTFSSETNSPLEQFEISGVYEVYNEFTLKILSDNSAFENGREVGIDDKIYLVKVVQEQSLWEKLISWINYFSFDFFGNSSNVIEEIPCRKVNLLMFQWNLPYQERWRNFINTEDYVERLDFWTEPQKYIKGNNDFVTPILENYVGKSVEQFQPYPYFWLDVARILIEKTDKNNPFLYLISGQGANKPWNLVAEDIMFKPEEFKAHFMKVFKPLMDPELDNASDALPWHYRNNLDSWLVDFYGTNAAIEGHMREILDFKYKYVYSLWPSQSNVEFIDKLMWLVYRYKGDLGFFQNVFRKDAFQSVQVLIPEEHSKSWFDVYTYLTDLEKTEQGNNGSGNTIFSDKVHEFKDGGFGVEHGYGFVGQKYFKAMYERYKYQADNYFACREGLINTVRQKERIVAEFYGIKMGRYNDTTSPIFLNTDFINSKGETPGINSKGLQNDTFFEVLYDISTPYYSYKKEGNDHTTGLLEETKWSMVERLFYLWPRNPYVDKDSNHKYTKYIKSDGTQVEKVSPDYYSAFETPEDAKNYRDNFAKTWDGTWLDGYDKEHDPEYRDEYGSPVESVLNINNYSLEELISLLSDSDFITSLVSVVPMVEITNFSITCGIILFIFLGLTYPLVSKFSNFILSTKAKTTANALLNFIIEMVRSQVGSVAIKMVNYVGTILIFILIANYLGMSMFGFTITSHIFVTFSMGVASWAGLTILGFVLLGWSFIYVVVPTGVPAVIMPMMIGIEIVSYCSRALSLSIRLFANLMAGHTLLHILGFFAVIIMKKQFIIGLIALSLILVIGLLEFCIAGLQGYVFSILISIYLNDSYSGGH